MRGTGAVFAIFGAVAALGLVASAGLPASAASIGFPPQKGSASKNAAKVNSKDLEAALITLGTGAQTIGGPGSFNDLPNEGSTVYEVLTGAAPDVCITVANVGNGDVDIAAAGATVVEVRVGRTRTACYGAPTQISLRCTDLSCAAVWRVDRQ